MQRLSSGVSVAVSRLATVANVQIRSFGVASVLGKREARRLRISGVVARALRRAPPPKLQKEALARYVKALKARGDDGARQVLDQHTATKKLAKESAALTSEDRRRLLAHYLPDEQDATQQLRKFTHKWLWRWMHRRDWRRWDSCLEELRNRSLPFDEVTYNMVIFGVLLHPRREDIVAREVFADMVEDGKFHPALLRLQQGFVDSYFELKEVDATPNALNLMKVAKTFWQISVNFKRRRIKELKRKLAAAVLEQRLASGSAELEEQTLALEGEFSDGEEEPRVRFPARRPRQLLGVHKGSGAPRRRTHRWKH